MNFIGKLLGGDFLNGVNKIVDNVVTTDAERKQLKNNLREIIAKAESQAQEQVTRRWEADASSGHWLSANIRPLTLIFLTVMFVIMSLFDGNVGGFTIDEAYKPIYQTLLITVYGAYFAGRSIEKVKNKQ